MHGANIASPARKRKHELQEDREPLSKRLKTLSTTPEPEVDSQSVVELDREGSDTEAGDDESGIELESNSREEAVAETNVGQNRARRKPEQLDDRTHSQGIVNKGSDPRSNQRQRRHIQSAAVPFGRRPAPKTQKDRPKQDRAPRRKQGSMTSEIADSQDGNATPATRPATGRSSRQLRTAPPRVSQPRGPPSNFHNEDSEEVTPAARQSRAASHTSARSVKPRAPLPREFSSIMASAAQTSKRF
jgi:hypothetical protein